MASAARAAVMVMRLSLAAGSGGVLPEGDDDVVAEGLELAAGVAGLAPPVGVPGVPVSPAAIQRPPDTEGVIRQRGSRRCQQGSPTVSAALAGLRLRPTNASGRPPIPLPTTVVGFPGR